MSKRGGSTRQFPCSVAILLAMLLFSEKEAVSDAAVVLCNTAVLEDSNRPADRRIFVGCGSDDSDLPPRPFAKPLVRILDARACAGVGVAPMVHLRGGRRMRDGAPAAIRHKRKQKQWRQASREQDRRRVRLENGQSLVHVSGGGLIHPTRLKHTVRQAKLLGTVPGPKEPVSKLRMSAGVLPRTKKCTAQETGHYPAKKNFLSKHERRALKRRASLLLPKLERACKQLTNTVASAITDNNGTLATCSWLSGKGREAVPRKAKRKKEAVGEAEEDQGGESRDDGGNRDGFRDVDLAQKKLEMWQQGASVADKAQARGERSLEEIQVDGHNSFLRVRSGRKILPVCVRSLTRVYA